MSDKQTKAEKELRLKDVQLRIKHSEMEKANALLINLDNIEEILSDYPDRELHQVIIKKRIGHLLNKMLETPLKPDDANNLIWHAEMRGRLMEEVQHANTLGSLNVHRGILENIKKLCRGAIEGMAKK